MASAEAHTAEAQKAIIKSADMSEEVQASAIEVARTALRTFETERDIAKHIKVRRFARRRWHD
jgi:dynein light chain LC8-type